MLILLAVPTHITTKTLTCGQAHTTDIHTPQLFFFFFCSFNILCLLSRARGCWCSLRSMEEKGSEQWKGISPHRGSKWQGSASTHWGPVRYTHTDRRRHTHTHAQWHPRMEWADVACNAALIIISKISKNTRMVTPMPLLKLLVFNWYSLCCS